MIGDKLRRELRGDVRMAREHLTHAVDHIYVDDEADAMVSLDRAIELLRHVRDDLRVVNERRMNAS